MLVLVGEIDRRHIPQGLVRPAKVILDEPLGEPTVEFDAVVGHIPELNELLLKGSVEPFIHRVVLGCFDPGMVLGNIQDQTGVGEPPFELGAVVVSDILDLPGDQIIEPIEEVARIQRALRPIHPGKGQLGVLVDGGEDETLGSFPINNDRIEAEQESGTLLDFEIGDLLAFNAVAPLFIDPRLFYRVVIEAILFDRFLHLPLGNRLVVFCLVESGDLRFSIANMRPLQTDDPVSLERGNGPLFAFSGRTIKFFKGAEVGIVKALLPLPKGLGADTEVASRQKSVFAVIFVPEEPIKTPPGGGGNADQVGDDFKPNGTAFGRDGAERFKITANMFPTERMIAHRKMS